MNRGLLVVLAIACGVGVGNVYFPQAVSPLVASGLGVSTEAAAMTATATQFGYTLGIFLLVPLADRLAYRPLMVTLLAVSGFALLGAGSLSSLSPLVVFSVAIGATTVSAQVAGPLAVTLSPEETRGSVMGVLLSGSIVGMLISRLFGGVLGEQLGWRAPYLVAGVMVLLVAIALLRVLPPVRPPVRTRWPDLWLGPGRLLCTEPLLRRSCYYQAGVFGAFSAVWTSLALLLTSDAYGLNVGVVGAIALVGAATAGLTPVAGRLTDRFGPDRVNLGSSLGALVATPLVAVGTLGTGVGLVFLVVGGLLLDVALQSGMVANQYRVYSISPEARGRLNTAYMTCAYLGGALGSWAGVLLYGAKGWLGVCSLATALVGGVLVLQARVARGARALRA